MMLMDRGPASVICDGVHPRNENFVNHTPVFIRNRFSQRTIAKKTMAATSLWRESREDEEETPVNLASLSVSASAVPSSNVTQRKKKLYRAINGQVSCLICHGVFLNERAVLNHYRKHNEDITTCFLCATTTHFIGLDQFLTHLQTVHVVETISAKLEKCQFCREKVSALHIPGHLLYECLELPRCVWCGLEFTLQADLNLHIHTGHFAKKTRFLCTHCPLKFYSLKMAIDHKCPSNMPTPGYNRCECNKPQIYETFEEFWVHYNLAHTVDRMCAMCGCDAPTQEHCKQYLHERQLGKMEDGLRRIVVLGGGELLDEEMHFDNDEWILLEELDDLHPPPDYAAGRPRSHPSLRLRSDPVPENIIPPASVICLADEEQMNNHNNDGILDVPPPSVMIIESGQNDRTISTSMGPPALPVHDKPKSTDIAQPLPSGMGLQALDDITLTASIREEVSNDSPAPVQHSIPDDGEDDVMIIDNLSQCMQVPSTGVKKNENDDELVVMSESSGVVTEKIVQINEGDDDCMMEAEVHHASGTTSAQVKSAREKKFKCHLCSEKYYTNGSLREHIKKHPTDSGAALTTCEGIYGLPLHDIDFFLCRLCCIVYSFKEKWDKHMAAHHGSHSFLCSKCPMISFNLRSAEQHSNYHKETGSCCLCPKCDITFATDNDLLQHAESIHNTKLLFFCKKCAYASLSKKKVYAHILCCNAKFEIHSAELNRLTPEMCFGVVSANLVHFQPIDEKVWQIHQDGPTPVPTVTPCDCSHRSFLAFSYPTILCPEENCWGWISTTGYIGIKESEKSRVERLVGMPKQAFRPSLFELAQLEQSPANGRNCGQQVQMHQMSNSNQRMLQNMLFSAARTSSDSQNVIQRRPGPGIRGPNGVRLLPANETMGNAIIARPNQTTQQSLQPSQPAHAVNSGNTAHDQFQTIGQALACSLSSFHQSGHTTSSGHLTQSAQHRLNHGIPVGVQPSVSQAAIRVGSAVGQMVTSHAQPMPQPTSLPLNAARPPNIIVPTTSSVLPPLARSGAPLAAALQHQPQQQRADLQTTQQQQYAQYQQQNQQRLFAAQSQVRAQVAAQPLDYSVCGVDILHVRPQLRCCICGSFHDSRDLTPVPFKPVVRQQWLIAFSQGLTERKQTPAIIEMNIKKMRLKFTLLGADAFICKTHFKRTVSGQIGEVVPGLIQEQCLYEHSHYCVFCEDARASDALCLLPMDPSLRRAIVDKLSGTFRRPKDQVEKEKQRIGNRILFMIYDMICIRHFPEHSVSKGMVTGLPYDMGINPSQSAVSGSSAAGSSNTVSCSTGHSTDGSSGYGSQDLTLHSSRGMGSGSLNIVTRYPPCQPHNEPHPPHICREMVHHQAFHAQMINRGQSTTTVNQNIHQAHINQQIHNSSRSIIMQNASVNSTSVDARIPICKYPHCQKLLRTDPIFKFHEMLHGMKDRFFCLDCRETMPDEQAMVLHVVDKQHVKDRIPEWDIACPVPSCNVRAMHATKMKQHLQTHADFLPYRNEDYCQLRFRTGQKMNHHHLQHVSKGHADTCCAICGEVAYWSVTHNGIHLSHLMAHAIRRYLRCRVCGEPAKGVDPEVHLAEHFVANHVVGSRNNTCFCAICKQNIEGRDALKVHAMEEHSVIAFTMDYDSPAPQPGYSKPFDKPAKGTFSVRGGRQMCEFLGIHWADKYGPIRVTQTVEYDPAI